MFPFNIVYVVVGFVAGYWLKGTEISPDIDKIATKIKDETKEKIKSISDTIKE